MSQVAIVTGGASGIGAACVRRLAASGCAVTIADPAGADDLVNELTASGGRVRAVRVDVGDEEQVAQAIAGIAAADGGLDIAINNAGVPGEYVDLHEMSLSSWRSSTGVNLDGVFLCMKHQIPLMLERGGGAIVNVSSMMGVIGSFRSPSYTAGKHGVNGLTKSAALQYGDRGIRVNAVCPGYIETPMSTGRLSSEQLEELAEMSPVKRLGTPEDVAALVCFLASEDATFITGSVHLVDGGYTAR